MVFTELVFLLGSCFVPIIIGLLAFIGIGRQVSASDLAQSLASMHQKLGNYRFYECATYSRLGSVVRYKLAFLSVVIAFIIYDVDFMFFMCEAVMIFHYSLVCYVVFSIFVICLVVGLAYDYHSVGFSWSAK